MTYITPGPVAIRQDYLRSINGGKLPAWARVIQPSPVLKQIRPMMSPMSDDWRDALPGAGGGGNITSLLGLDISAPSNTVIALTVAAGLALWYRSRT